METLKKIGSAVLTCTFALGGMGIGAVTGALQGQTSETGMVRGTIIGAVAGAVVAIDFLESCLHGELLSKVALFGSLLNGKIFREWVTPSILIAYQSQVNTQETIYADTSDLFDISGSKGLHLEMISKLPQMKITSFEVVDPFGDAISCAVCLQDFKWGEDARRLPACGHFFHMLCIDAWLQSHGSCPFCRREVQAILEQKFL